MMRGKSLSEEQKAEAMRMRADGLSWRKIGRAFGVNEETVTRALDPDYKERRNAGIRAARGLRCVGQRRTPVPTAKQAQICTLAAEHPGWTQARIAREAEVSSAYASTVLNAGKPKRQPRVQGNAGQKRSGPPTIKTQPLPPVPPPPPNISPVRFLDRRSGQCAFLFCEAGTPLTEMMCCGNKCPREPDPQVCEYHFAVCYVRRPLSKQAALHGLKRAA